MAVAVLTACSWPVRQAKEAVGDELAPLPGFEHVRAVDGFRNEHFQTAFDVTVAEFVKVPADSAGRRDFDMLVLSSGGVNGAFGAGILTEWSRLVEGGRPDFWIVTGVSVGALMAPFAFAGREFDARLQALFARIDPEDMHREKGLISSVLFDESLLDNRPLRDSIAAAVDEDLLAAVAARHVQGRRLYVGTTNLDLGHFVVWDLGAIATVGGEAALELFRDVLTASAAIPVVYPPVRFEHAGDKDELHVDGAVIRPLFMPQNIFDGYLSADRAGLDWDAVDATMYVVHNGSLRPQSVDVQRDTLNIATRTVTMMSYTMITEHVLHLYMLCRAWGAEFRFVTMDYGNELDVNDFTSDDTLELFRQGRDQMRKGQPWQKAPPGYLVNRDFDRIQPAGESASSASSAGSAVEARLERIERQLGELQEMLRPRGDGK